MHFRSGLVHSTRCLSDRASGLKSSCRALSCKKFHASNLFKISVIEEQCVDLDQIVQMHRLIPSSASIINVPGCIKMIPATKWIYYVHNH